MHCQAHMGFTGRVFIVVYKRTAHGCCCVLLKIQINSRIVTDASWTLFGTPHSQTL